MSEAETTKPAAESAAATPPVTIAYKFNGVEEKLDLSKPEDIQKAKTYIELGRFSEKQTAKVRAAEERVAALSADAELGKGWRDFASSNPEGAAVIGGLMASIRDGRLDPSQVRQALAAQREGDVGALEAQARATLDPQARGLLQSMAADLQSVKGELEAVKQTAAQRRLTEEIAGTLSTDVFLKRSSAAMAQAHRRTEALVREGMTVDQAAILAAQEVKDLANELANAELKRVEDGQNFRTAKPSDGLPPLKEHLAKRVDSKAHPRLQEEQRVNALTERFRAFQRRAEGE